MSSDHRIVRVGRDLSGSSSPIPLPKQGHLQQPAQELVQAGLEYLQRKRLHNLPGQPVPVLRQKSPVFFHVSAVSCLTSQTKLNSTSAENLTWETSWLQTPQSITVWKNPRCSENRQLSLDSSGCLCKLSAS